MLRRRGNLSGVLVLLALAVLPGRASARSWSFDAGTIGMGGVGGSGNLATKMLEEQRPDTSIVLPLGLIQVLGDTDVFNPDSKKSILFSPAYNGDGFAIAVEVGDGFGGRSFHGGVEKRLGAIDVRGRARYTVMEWNPTAGIGLNLSKNVALDVAVFGTNANIERTHEAAIAASIRVNHMKK